MFWREDTLTLKICKGIITLFILTFWSNIQFSIVVFKKINLVPMVFKIYPKWSFLLSRTLRRQVLLIWQRELFMWQREVGLRDVRWQVAAFPNVVTLASLSTTSPSVVVPAPSTKPPAASPPAVAPMSSPPALVPVSSPPSSPHHGESGS